MWLSVSHIFSFRKSCAIILAALVVAMFLDVEDLHKTELQQASPAPADLMSLLQGTNIHVDILGAHNRDAKSKGHVDRHQNGKEVDDVSFFSRTKSVTKTRRPVSLVSTSSTVIHSVLSLRSKLKQLVTQHVAQHLTDATTGLAVTMLIALICCTLFAACSIVYPNKFPWSRQEGSVPPEAEPAVAAIRQQREYQMLSSKQLSPAVQNAYPKVPGSGPFASALSPFTQVMTPAMTPATTSAQPQMPGESAVQERGVPPPLCPTLVMPICEARFGVPMYELAELSAEGELSVVGLSGNPLLRAVVRKIGTARTLEISMPEQNSAPRATISPSPTELAGHGQQGSRALEIRGMRGSFYGMLEMRGSGACYVVRNGETVLTIDGDAESLQLSIKSSVGLPLASVRCSAEPFGGVDHVEIRVEPAVDTVLVIAVVLAVLLLSPYLPPPDQ